MKKITLILLTVFLFVFANSVFATDLSVTCTGSSCDLSPAGGALFNETNFAPGQSVTRTIYVQNNNSNDDCSLNLIVKNPHDETNLASVLAAVINDGSTNLYSDLFSQLFPTKTINMGVIPKSGSKTFSWLVTLNSAADNSYQNSQTTFDFDMAFTCGVPPTNPTTGTTTTSSIAPPPTCNDADVGGVPGNFSVVSGGLGVVVLSWTPPPNPYTYFLIAYSDNSSWPPKWGNPSVGNVTSYTVSGLGSGTYWFWVRAGNGCKPGSYAGPVSLGAISGVSGGGVAPGFAPGVLGTQENLSSGVSTQAGEVKGAKSEPWWLLLFLIFPFLWLLRIILSKMSGNESS